MIIWLASYPKSGNTWVRIFLNSLIFSKKNLIDINKINIRLFPIRNDFNYLNEDIDKLEVFVKNCLDTQFRINLDNKIKIFKTHNAFWKSGDYCFTDKQNTIAIIYIVRDPRNVITSIKNHFSHENYEESLDFILDEKKIVGFKKDNKKLQIDLPTVISSWKNHFNSWKKLNSKYLLIKYENLLINPINEFTKITKFIEEIYRIKFGEKKILETIESCKFQNLQKQENLNGFTEATYNKFGKPINFFNLGPENNWEKLLDENIRKKIENKFENEMKELKYL